MNPVIRAKLDLIIAVTAFGTIGIFVRYIALPSSIIALVRGAVGAAFLWLLLRWKKTPFQREALRPHLKLLVLSGVIMSFNWITLFEAYNYTTVATATLCYYMAPVFVTLASPFLFHERLTARKLLCILTALCGMVSGSSVGNTVTTGSVTIPMMKKTGYKGEFAGAVEAAASTGGQIMPPIMGAGAFIMAEIIGVQYAQIAAAAVLPAVAYFLAVFILVHMIAKKKGLGKDSGVHYEGKPILPRVYRLLPIIVLVIMIIMGYSLPRSAIYCTIFSIIMRSLLRPAWVPASCSRL